MTPNIVINKIISHELRIDIKNPSSPTPSIKSLATTSNHKSKKKTRHQEPS